uniref:Uncharacterized protein n=1 Tax=Romanomermis culicivorax TaxID=13658 RepID=A0A915L7I1_ROMCU
MSSLKNQISLDTRSKMNWNSRLSVLRTTKSTEENHRKKRKNLDERNYETRLLKASATTMMIHSVNDDLLSEKDPTESDHEPVFDQKQ